MSILLCTRPQRPLCICCRCSSSVSHLVAFVSSYFRIAVAHCRHGFLCSHGLATIAMCIHISIVMPTHYNLSRRVPRVSRDLYSSASSPPRSLDFLGH
ncbi:hypothetical protein CPB85DRAFT_265558 [Mucidula mucida]|nr:hypothetical protein CPB85DRAFT_265558 [Mucidula mucida]